MKMSREPLRLHALRGSFALAGVGICVATLLACQPQSEPGEPGGTSLVTTTSEPEAPATDPSATGEASQPPQVVPPAPLPTCEPFTGPEHLYTSAVDVETRIAGSWFLCSGKIAAPTGAQGIELADGRGTFLVTAGNQLFAARTTTPFGPQASSRRDRRTS